MKKITKYCVSIDWLQAHFFANDKKLFDSDFSVNKIFSIKKLEIKSPVFSKFIRISIQNRQEWEEIAILSYEPHSKILPEKSCHVKINNKYLYSSSLDSFFYTIADEFNLSFKSISRLDVAIDFLQFNSLTVPTFFKRFISRKYLKYKSVGFHMDGFASKSMPIHYLRFGSRSTPVHFYIYNKSKELREKHKKPHIEKKWKEYGLLHKTYDVWRMEFVLTPSKHGFITTDGDILQMNDLQIFQPEYLKDLLFSLIGRYAQFVINDGQKRKDRMQKISLFNDEPYHDKYLRVDDKQQSSRVDKMYIKKLYEMQQAWREYNTDKLSIDDAMHDYIRKKDLESWAIQNGIMKAEDYESLNAPTFAK